MGGFPNFDLYALSGTDGFSLHGGTLTCIHFYSVEYKHAEAAHQPQEHIDAIRQNKIMLQYLYPEHKRKVMEELVR